MGRSDLNRDLENVEYCGAKKTIFCKLWHSKLGQNHHFEDVLPLLGVLVRGLYLLLELLCYFTLDLIHFVYVNLSAHVLTEG